VPWQVARPISHLENRLRYERDQPVFPPFGRALYFDEVFLASVFGN
jgi:hypothetical protein